MPTAEARIATDRASRYLVQLCRHTDMMRRMRHRPPAAHARRMPQVQHAEWSDTHGTVRFAEGRWTLDATPEALTLYVEADDGEALQRLQNGITVRLEKIGRRDGLTVTWQCPPTPPAPPSGAQAPKSGRSNLQGAAEAIGLLSVGALVVALHLGVAGAALATSAWTDWAANGVLVLIALKVVLMAGHVFLGRAGIRRGKAFMTHRRPPQAPPEATPTIPPEAVGAQAGLMASEEQA
ncbi:MULTISPECIES: DUF2218 domain-containing protein [unclassified Streptomyces]|uniref:DUF2218 domain-containing protein n=1 Tax=unclassified Streptomyces TaxID=2593676 RepID=UPI0027407F10|nr:MULTISPECIES: DUF2218 domain-containing protein [unclassified Streptomyces]